jgi:hypothetical protein
MPISKELFAARRRVAKWLPPREDEALCGVTTSDMLSERFLEIARKAKFGMGITVSGNLYSARWTHPECRCSELPSAGSVENAEDARLLACAALLESKAARFLIGHK